MNTAQEAINTLERERQALYAKLLEPRVWIESGERRKALLAYEYRLERLFAQKRAEGRCK